MTLRRVICLLSLVASGCGTKSPDAPARRTIHRTDVSTTGTIVPLYSYPTTDYWNQLIQASLNHPNVPVIVIANPASGPGTSVDPNWTTGISQLVDAGVTPIGYVTSSYARRAIADVTADFDTWQSMYPAVQGIFIDEMNNTVGQESYYQALTDYAHAHGLGLTVANPGTDVPASFIGTSDVIQVYENSGLPSLDALAVYAPLGASNFGIIPYSIAALPTDFVAAAKQDVGYIYFSTDGLNPMPWGGLPPYFDALLGALEAP
jgi:hypothetical protein